MISAGLIGRGRALSDSIMPDQCQVTRSGGEPVLDEASGLLVDPGREVVYDGPFRSRGVTAVPGEIESASQLLVETDASVAFPVSIGSALIETDDILEWTAAAFDPALVGAKVRITGPFTKTSHAVARRFRVEETS